MKKWKTIIALILALTIFLSVGCISVLAATDGTFNPASNNPAPSNSNFNSASSNSNFNSAPSNSNQYYDDDEDEECYTIYATAHKGGSISPTGAVDVWEGSDQAFEITPKSKYKIEKVLVDGRDKGALEFYEFEDVDCDHTIEVFFISIAEPKTEEADTEFNPNTGAY